MKNRLTQANRKIAQLENAVLNNVEAKTYSNIENDDETLKNLVNLTQILSKNSDDKLVLDEINLLKGDKLFFCKDKQIFL